MTDWDVISNAMFRAVHLASGLDENKVVWKDQDVNAPNDEYITIQLTTLITVGIDYIKRTYDATRPRGQEFKLEVVGTRETALEIECFTTPAVSGAKGAALARCNSVVMGLSLPSIRTGLKRADVSIFDPGPVQWIADIPNTDFRGRAICSIRCYVPAPSVAEYVGTIERMSGQVTSKGGTHGDVVNDFDTGAVADENED